MAEDNALAGINKRLDALIAIMINQTKIQEATMKERILMLTSFGFSNSEIAAMLGTSSGLVAKERYLSKKVKKAD